MKTSTFVRRLASLSSTVCLASATQLAAHASTADNVSTTSVRVRVSDLDLSTPDGVGVLKQRIRHAAVQVCGDFDQRDLQRAVKLSRCRDEAANRALEKLGLMDQ